MLAVPPAALGCCCLATSATMHGLKGTQDALRFLASGAQCVYNYSTGDQNLHENMCSMRVWIDRLDVFQSATKFEGMQAPKHPSLPRGFMEKPLS
jgi:hypothetical protein